MLSYDYCHFEICLSRDEEIPLSEVNELRKDAQRLADEAVRQFKIAKVRAEQRVSQKRARAFLVQEVDEILNIPEAERDAEQKAKVKAITDDEYWTKYNYDYEDEV